MRVQQVARADFLDIEKIVFGGDLAQRHNFNAVSFSIRRVEKQVFEIAAVARAGAILSWILKLKKIFWMRC